MKRPRTNPESNFDTNTLGKEVAMNLPYPSSTDPDKKYYVRLYKDGTTSCNCKGWAMQTRFCKHTTDVDKKKGAMLASMGINVPGVTDNINPLATRSSVLPEVRDSGVAEVTTIRRLRV